MAGESPPSTDPLQLRDGRETIHVLTGQPDQAVADYDAAPGAKPGDIRALANKAVGRSQASEASWSRLPMPPRPPTEPTRRAAVFGATAPISRHLRVLRRRRWYDVATRLLGSLWFLLLAAVTAKAAWLGMTPHDSVVWSLERWPFVVSRICLAIFYLGLWALIIFRPPAVAQSDGLLPALTAIVGTYLPWSIPLMGHARHSELLSLSSAVGLLVGGILMIVTLAHLGRSFSLVPQARRVVSAGPYRWIRHPLYLSEGIAIMATALQYLSLLVALVLVALAAVQIRRILYEEELLGRTLPEYADYERSRWRLIPFVW
jgi:protein-S-isoprenylcysteine O-methyltransferase Ste14